MSLTPLRRARIQHNILAALEGGRIGRIVAMSKLVARLGMSEEVARAVIDGEHRGENI